MRLKNLMENKQLDFNQPFLSVRRFSSLETPLKANERGRSDNPWPSLPVYKSELKSGPVRNPGNVPFLWEQAPGRPKDERKSQTTDSKGLSSTPKLPPGMSSNLKQHCSKDSPSGAETRSLPEDVDKKIVKHHTLKETIKRDLDWSSEGGDEAYIEAADTLSRANSFFNDCSVTGLSGLDGADVKPSRTFSTDPQTRDFMMGRFLPAAMAMASETFQVAYRKHGVQREQQREAKKIAEMDKEPTLNPPNYPPNNGEEESEDEDIDLLDGPENSSAKTCGLFARFCLRGSFCLLNPVPGLRMRGPMVSSAHGVQNDNLIDNSCSTVKNLREAARKEKSSHGNQMLEQLHEEKIMLRGQSKKISQQKLEKSSLCTNLKKNDTSNDPKKLSQSLLSEGNFFSSGPGKVKKSKVHSEPHRTGRSKFRELLADEFCSSSPVIEKMLYVDSVDTVKHQGSNSSSADMKAITELMGDVSSKSTGSSENKEIKVQPSSIGDLNRKLRSKSVESMDTCFLSCSGRSNYDPKLDLKASSLEVDLLQNAMILAKAEVADERTVDFESQQSEKSGNQDSSGEYIANYDTSEVIESEQIRLGSPRHIKSTQEENSDSSFHDFASFISSKASNKEKLHLESKVAKRSDIVENSDDHNQSSISSKSTAEGKIDLESNLPTSIREPNGLLPISSQLPLAPPLPKAPSESWLKRTLPTASTRNSTPHSTLAARIMLQGRTPCTDLKWEEAAES